MTFYKSCLGGKLMFQTVGESPIYNKMPKKMKQCILHSTLIRKDFVLMGSDMAPDTALIKGNTVALVLNCYTENDIRTYFDKLSLGGVVKHPLENTFWGALFCELTDKFGNHWLLNFNNQ
ncbi:VOC family protein [Maribacter cobaltidurans]|nr:VOC family protein [Maribacter cobaltidurans]